MASDVQRYEAFYPADGSPGAESVNETGEGAKLYIEEGDSIYAPFDLKGLHVFAVIQTLRLVDTAIQEGALSLSKDQQTRLSEVEEVVDEAIKKDMQYYPFGHTKELRSEIDYDTLSRIGGRRSGSVVNVSGPAGTNPYNQKRTRRSRRIETPPEKRSGPVKSD